MSMIVIPPVAIGEGGGFTRSTTKRYIGSAGAVQTAAINAPAWQFDPTNLNAAPVALIENAATNLLLQSNTLSTTWTKTGASISAAAIAAMTTSGSIDKIVESSANSRHGISQLVAKASSPVAYAYSGVAKAGERTTLEFNFEGSVSGVARASFDLIAGTCVITQAIDFSNASATITSKANGLYLCVLSATSNSDNGIYCEAYLENGLGLDSYLGDSVSGLYVGDLQLEAGAAASSRIPTTTVAVTRAADVIIGTGLVYSSAVETPPAAYAGGTTYALDDTVSVAGSAGLRTVYRSLQASNTGHAPASSPTWWVSIGTTYQVYAGGTTYALGDIAIDTTAHHAYESLEAGNVGQALTDGTKWLDLGPTNKWAMFDQLRNTTTLQPVAVMAILAPGERVDALALLGMVGATSATVSVTSSGVLVYSVTRDLNTREISDWYAYFFAPFTTKGNVALFDLPPYVNAIVSIAITAPSGNVELGACGMALQQNIGDVQYEAVSDALNFSTVTRDVDGTATMIQRRNAPKTVSSIWLNNTELNRVRRLRDALDGSPAVWCGLSNDSDDSFESLLISGYWTTFSIDLKYPLISIISLELQEI